MCGSVCFLSEWTVVLGALGTHILVVLMSWMFITVLVYLNIFKGTLKTTRLKATLCRLQDVKIQELQEH